MYPRAGFSSKRETVLGNVPEADRMEQQVRIQELKKKIKHNITTCREAMAKTKETPRLRDSKGNFLAGRGRDQLKQRNPGVGEKGTPTQESRVETTEEREESTRGDGEGAPDPGGIRDEEGSGANPRDHGGERQEPSQNVEMVLDTEDELPKEGENLDGIRIGPLVANAFNQLSEMASRYDWYEERSEEGLGDIREDPMDSYVGPPTKAASKERTSGRKDKSPVKKREISHKDRQAQVMQKYQQMMQTFTEPQDDGSELPRAEIEGMTEVRVEGEGNNHSEVEGADPVRGAHRDRQNTGAAVRTPSAARTRKREEGSPTKKSRSPRKRVAERVENEPSPPKIPKATKLTQGKAKGKCGGKGGPAKGVSGV